MLARPVLEQFQQHSPSTLSNNYLTEPPNLDFPHSWFDPVTLDLIPMDEDFLLAGDRIEDTMNSHWWESSL